MTDNDPTLLWHDYETFGQNPASDRPAQFAALRTDLDLNPVDDPVVIYCQVPNDYLPQPEACLITGITPQLANRKGVCEAQFAALVHEQFSRPNTCAVGYNSIRFDDEVSRHLFYRNFYDPYAREWQHGNSRWDVLDLMRAAYALRPEGIDWPLDEDGLPSFRLERLSEANHIEHANAHDALADVHATIEMARKVKLAQPKLYDYLFALRNKRRVTELLDMIHLKPLVHISGMFPAAQGCASYVVPLAWHPTNKNAAIMVNLAEDLTPLLELDVDTLRQRLYTRRDELPDGAGRPPLKLVHINKCPVLAPAKTLTETRADQLGIDREQCRLSLNLLRQHPQLRDKVCMVFQDDGVAGTETDPDKLLYRGGFFSHADKAAMEIIRQTPAEQLVDKTFHFNDPRLPEMLLRYRARNFPQNLTPEEEQRWQLHRQQVLQSRAADFQFSLEQLAQEHQHNERKMKILSALLEYAQQL